MKCNVYLFSFALFLSISYVNSVPNLSSSIKWALKEADNAKSYIDFFGWMPNDARTEAEETKKVNEVKDVLQSMVSGITKTPFMVRTITTAKTDEVLEALSSIDEIIKTLTNKYPAEGLRKITNQVKTARSKVIELKSDADELFQRSTSWRVLQELTGQKEHETQEHTES